MLCATLCSRPSQFQICHPTVQALYTPVTILTGCSIRVFTGCSVLVVTGELDARFRWTVEAQSL